MPETIEPASPPEVAAPAAPLPKPQRQTDPLAKIKTKYNLNRVTRVNEPGPGGKPLGKGPILSPEVINKFAELDNTPDKRYLDWMLYQAGGGEKAYNESLRWWGGDTKKDKPITPDFFISKFNQAVPHNVLTPQIINDAVAALKSKFDIEVPQLLTHSNELVQASHAETEPEKYRNVLELLGHYIPSKKTRETVTRYLLTYRFKNWLRGQGDTRIRDRVHVATVWNLLASGKTLEEAEAEWAKTEHKRRREALVADEDALKWGLFAYARHWPGKNGIYERIYNVMREFLSNKNKIEQRNSQLDQYNATIAARNKELPPDQQMSPREPINVSTDIGKVVFTKQGLKYTGRYPTVESLAKANEDMNDLPMRERVQNDVRYAGHKGRSGRGEKIYSDNNLDVQVPLTVAASIRAGHSSWDVSDPDQTQNLKDSGSSSSTWTRWALGQHDHQEWAGSQAIPVFFNFKTRPPFKALLMVFLDDMSDLRPPYMGTIWQVTGVGGDDLGKIHFSDMIKHLKANVPDDVFKSVLRSLKNAMWSVSKWGQEFEPQDLVADYVSHHQSKLQPDKKRRMESIQMRATQVVEMLLE